MSRLGRRPTAPVLCVLAALAACHAAPPPVPPAAPAPETHGTPLRVLMQRLDMLLHERNATELELDKQRLARGRELAAAAAVLPAQAQRLGPPYITDATTREAFAALARRFAEEAATLGALADARRYSAFDRQLQRVEALCSVCHARFRDPVR